jgi:hypothetical protein
MKYILILVTVTLISLGQYIAISPALAMSNQEFQNFKIWINIDKTDENNYLNITYDCLMFSRNFAANATIVGFKDVYMVNIQSTKYPDGHWIIATLVNGQYRFFEPQADIEVFPTKSQLLIVDNNYGGTKKMIIGDNEIIISGEVLLRS